MKTNCCITLLLTIVLLSNCTKSGANKPLGHINCDELVTDTTGTNDRGKFYMPDAFSPNNDGLNDVYKPVKRDIASLNLTIYDEDNTVLFTTDQLGQGWAGTSAATSFTKYYYRIQATTLSGHHIGQCGDLYQANCIPMRNAIPLFFEDQFTSQFGSITITNEQLPTCP